MRDAPTKNAQPLTLSDRVEAEIATEFGDGTKFKVGDTVWHDHAQGRFWKKEG